MTKEQEKEEENQELVRHTLYSLCFDASLVSLMSLIIIIIGLHFTALNISLFSGLLPLILTISYGLKAYKFLKLKIRN